MRTQVKLKTAFFMISLEGLREHDPNAVVTAIPLAPQLGGDFSGLQNGTGNQVTIYDPLTTTLGPDGKTYVRTPFAGMLVIVKPETVISWQEDRLAAGRASFEPEQPECSVLAIVEAGDHSLSVSRMPGFR